MNNLWNITTITKLGKWNRSRGTCQRKYWMDLSPLKPLCSVKISDFYWKSSKLINGKKISINKGFNAYKFSSENVEVVYSNLLSTKILWRYNGGVRAKRNVALKIWNTIRLFVFPTFLINQGIKQPTMLYGRKKEPT